MGESRYAEYYAKDEIDDYDNPDELYDNWDFLYGKGTKDYETYILCDTSKPCNEQFGPLKFAYEPFYVGHGKRGRARKSCNISFWEMKNMDFQKALLKRWTFFLKFPYWESKTH